MIMKKFVLAVALSFIPIMTNLTPSLAQITDRNMSAETGINYDELERLLATKQWRRANDLTFDLLLKASGRASQGWIDIESYSNLPCNDLQIIDDLWTKYSRGHFGFSVQLPIFIRSGNRPGRLADEEAFELFGDRLGWRRNNDWIAFKENLIYDLNAPEGHLPNPRYEYEITGSRLEYTTFAQRLIDCEVVENLPPVEPPKPLDDLSPNQGDFI